ncbi:MAG: hypothetical protein RKO66_09885 [Candidatus Contendobacter sp.]|nr:hypothetical protein [Candidatus Contendobacter sp.]MDS4060144.1 hypothetical protein [Candidatus Contendobacter sp.]
MLTLTVAVQTQKLARMLIDGRDRLAFADVLAPPPQTNDVGGFVGRVFSALFFG